MQISLKLSEMVVYNARNILDFFQVQKKSGTYFFFSKKSGSVFENFWMIQKSKKILLLQITQNGPIHENKWF